MTFNIKEYIEKQQYLKSVNSKAIIVAVSKTRPKEDIEGALMAGIRHFGETKVQEALYKFKSFKVQYNDLLLHMIGSLQTNKVKKSLTIFDYFHSLDRDNLALEFSKYPQLLEGKYFFIQVNTGQEKQKSGILPKQTTEFVRYCLYDLNLNIVGLMCLPPINEDSKKHFVIIRNLASENNLKHLSIGMSADYKTAIDCGATFIRIGTSFFWRKKINCYGN